MRRFLILLVPVLALGMGGCAGSEDKSTDGDKQLVHQIYQAQALTIAAVDLAISFLTGDFVQVHEAVAALDSVRPAMKDVSLNTKQLAENFGPPNEPKDYSPEASAAAREQSKKEHANVGFWVGIGGIVMTGLTVAWAYVRTTGFGHLIDAFVGSGQKVRAKAANGGLTAEDAKELYAATVKLLPKSTQAKIEAALTKAKAKVAKVTSA